MKHKFIVTTLCLACKFTRFHGIMRKFVPEIENY